MTTLLGALLARWHKNGAEWTGREGKMGGLCIFPLLWLVVWLSGVLGLAGVMERDGVIGIWRETLANRFGQLAGWLLYGLHGARGKHQ